MPERHAPEPYSRPGQHEGSLQRNGAAETSQDPNVHPSETESNARDRESTAREAPDFSALPDPVLLLILKVLSLEDRYHLSLACRRLHALFSHPSVWRSVTLSCSGADSKCRVGLHAKMPAHQRTLVARFGRHFEDVTVRVTGHLVNLDEESRQALTQVATACNLRALRLGIGPTRSASFRAGFEPRVDSVSVILDLARRAAGLKRLELISWPLHADTSFVGLFHNALFTDLQSLNMFYNVAGHWFGASDSVTLKHPLPIAALTSKFRSLQHLYIQDRMLSDELLLSLAAGGRSQLKTLSVLVCHIPSQKDDEGFPREELTPSAWRKLSSACPDLEVRFSLVARSRDSQLAWLFHPEVPVTGVTLYRFSRCSVALLALLRQYGKSLRSFICYHADCGDDCEEALVGLVNNCPRLRHLVFWGRVRSCIIAELASLDRCWRIFEFREKNVVTAPAAATAEAYDEDVVVRKNAEGILVLASVENRLKNVESEEERQEELERLNRAVSRYLGYSWKPVSEEYVDATT